VIHQRPQESDRGHEALPDAGDAPRTTRPPAARAVGALLAASASTLPRYVSDMYERLRDGSDRRDSDDRATAYSRQSVGGEEG
jgi:hypothetical protein